MADKKREHYEEKFKRDKRALREGALILYFESLFRDDGIDELYDAALEAGYTDISEASCELAEKVKEKEPELDGIISSYSKKRSIQRIAKINLAILRLAVYEARYEEKVPVNVAISEAVLLARKFARDEDVSFINGVLGAYSRTLGENNND